MLTAKEVETAKPKATTYRLYDGLGLYLEVRPNGKKHWRHKYRYTGKERRLVVGPFPEISLLEAREKRDQARKLLATGIDPITDKKDRRNAILAKAAITFEVVAREWHDTYKDRWTARYRKDIMHRIEMDIFPKIGKLPTADIRPSQLISTLRHIEDRGAHVMAQRALQYCGQILRYAVITERADRDFTPELKGALKPFKRGHYAAIDAEDLPEFLMSFERNEARLYAQTQNAIRLLMLTFVRTGELIGASWNEFNFESKEWVIPAERMKMKRPHIVPLANQTIELLKKQKTLTGKWEWVFPNVAYPKKHMSNNTILGAIRRLGYKGRMTGHGFRALAMSTIKERLGYRHEVVDRQLAHAPANKVDAAYDRAKFLDERKVMMQECADYLDKVSRQGGGQSNNVLQVDFQLSR